MNVADGHQRTNQVRYEAGRLSGAISLSHTLKEGASLKLEALYPFPWEKSETKAIEMTPEILEALAEFDKNTPHPDTWAQ